jgi:hypothetical protein
MNTFLNFIETRKRIIVESFNNKDIDKAFEVINKVLKKHIDELIILPGYAETKQGNKELYSKQYIIIQKDYKKCRMFQLNFLQNDKSTDIYSIDFFDNLDILFDGKSKSKLTIYTLGSSVAYMLPIIWRIALSQDYNLSDKDLVKIGKDNINKIKESYGYYVDNLRYSVFENLSENLIYETWNIHICDTILKNQQTIKESKADMNEIRKFRNKKYDELRIARDEKTKNKSKENIDRWKKVISEIQEIDNALRGGASTLGELKIAVKHNVSLISEINKEISDMQKKIEDELESPDLAFKKMQQYVKMVIKGINPSLIICGAPGVGKTFNVKQQLKAAGYNEGHNLCTIKGKCSPRILYTTLLEYKHKGDIVLIDDADGLVGPGAPEDSLNILKAALDSESDDEGRLVVYGIAGPLKDDEGVPLPKRFYFNGGVIVITNYRAGMLDSALRGRSFIQDMNFTPEQMLERIKKCMNSIGVGVLTPKSKIKAFDYLNELATENVPLEISMRTFGICAKIFQTAEGESDFSEEDVKSMIREQMKLQAQKREKGMKSKY